MSEIRDDLRLRPYAAEKGWTEEFSQTDRRFERFGITNADCPHDSINFVKGNLRAVLVGRSYPTLEFWWSVMELKDERYYLVKRYDTLQEALDHE